MMSCFCPPRCPFSVFRRRGAGVVGLVAVCWWPGVSAAAAGEGEPPPTTARALAFPDPRGGLDWHTGRYRQPSEVLLTNLGLHDENGHWTAPHIAPEGSDAAGQFILSGKYLETNNGGIATQIPRVNSPINEFLIDYLGEVDSNPAEAILWSSEINIYYHINRYRTGWLNADFIADLQLDPEIEQNLLHRQFRPGLVGQRGETALPKKPSIVAIESTTAVFAGQLNPITNAGWFGTRSRRFGGENMDVISHAFDPGFIVGEYSGLLAFLIHGTSKAFPYDFRCTDDWTFNMTSCLNDALNAWVAYRYTGETEVFRTFFYNSRKWTNRSCDTETGIPCFRGKDIDNVMMLDLQTTSGDQVFPFDRATPFGITPDDAPLGTDLASLFITAVFYDISYELGLGDRKADLLFWKSLSLIDNVDHFTMRQFADTILAAAAELWPSHHYAPALTQVLVSRGLLPSAIPTIYDGLPGRIGGEENMPVYNPVEKFGSLHPDPQVPRPHGNYSYGARRVALREYQNLDSDFQYLTFQFYKHSKYGPCDKVQFSNGNFGATPGDPSFGKYLEDGSYFTKFEGRELGNTSLFIPGGSFRYNRFRAHCQNEAEAPFFLDVNPFGFFATQEMKNGFSIEVSRLAEHENSIDYEITIFDPSVHMTGPRTGPAHYYWSLQDYKDWQIFLEGSTVQVTLPKNEPIQIQVERVRGSESDTLTLVERSNDLDRGHGRAFVRNCLESGDLELLGKFHHPEEAVVELVFDGPARLDLSRFALRRGEERGWVSPGLLETLSNDTNDLFVIDVSRLPPGDYRLSFPAEAARHPEFCGGLRRKAGGADYELVFTAGEREPPPAALRPAGRLADGRPVFLFAGERDGWRREVSYDLLTWDATGVGVMELPGEAGDPPGAVRLTPPPGLAAETWFLRVTRE